MGQTADRIESLQQIRTEWKGKEDAGGVFDLQRTGRDHEARRQIPWVATPVLPCSAVQCSVGQVHSLSTRVRVHMWPVLRSQPIKPDLIPGNNLRGW